VLKLNQEKQSCQQVKKSPERTRLTSFSLEALQTWCKAHSLLLAMVIRFYRVCNYSVHPGKEIN